MSEQDVAQQAASTTPAVQTGVSLFATALGGYLTKHFWDRRKGPRQPGVSHADFTELKEILENLRLGQEERGKQMAVIEATMATKQDLSVAVAAMTKEAKTMVDGVHNRLSGFISEHLRDHAKE